MKVRATAAASHHANAVGKLELECTPAGLVMVYLEVGAYSTGYAPGALTRGTRVIAPWADVVAVRAVGDHVHLTLTPQLTPHHQLTLVDFSDGTRDDTTELRRRRWLLRGATGLLIVIGLLSLSAIAAGWSAQARQGTALWIAFLGACVLLALGLFAEKLWLNPGPTSDQVRDAFLNELRRLRPAPVLTQPFEERDRPADLMDLLHAIPRSTTAIVIVLTAASLGGILTSNWIVRGGTPPRRATVAAQAAESPPPPPPEAQRLPEPPPTAAPTSAPVASGEPLPKQELRSCTCKRADSVLWRLPFPRLSTLLIEQKLRRHKDHHHVELELGVVNNSNESLKEVMLLVQFFEGKGKRPTKDRHLYYESSLRPGQAIKWHVEARGDSFKINNPDQKPVEQDQLASADAFAALLNANHRPVRLHGAMMLAYYGDQRAKKGAMTLREALREEEAPYLDRVLQTQRDSTACDLRVESNGRHRKVELCAYNSSPEAIDELAVKLRALDNSFDHRNPVAPPPVVLAEKVWRLPGTWPGEQGHWVTLTLDTDNPSGQVAKAVEAFVDRPEALY